MSGPEEEVIRPAIKKKPRRHLRSGVQEGSVAVLADRFINAYWKQVGR